MTHLDSSPARSASTPPPSTNAGVNQVSGRSGRLGTLRDGGKCRGAALLGAPAPGIAPPLAQLAAVLDALCTRVLYPSHTSSRGRWVVHCGEHSHPLHPAAVSLTLFRARGRAQKCSTTFSVRARARMMCAAQTVMVAGRLSFAPVSRGYRRPGAYPTTRRPSRYGSPSPPRAPHQSESNHLPTTRRDAARNDHLPLVGTASPATARRLNPNPNRYLTMVCDVYVCEV